MSAEALQFQLTSQLGSTQPLLVYYDFLHSSVFTTQSGSVHQAYVRNTSPSSKTGFYDGKIIGASGASSAAALLLATGAAGFMANGTGDLTKNYVQVSGASGLDLNSCSYLMLVNSDLRDDGVLLGSFEKVVESAGGSDVVSSKGFNFGITDRGQNFIQSLGGNGEFCFVKENDDLTKRSVLGINFSSSEASLHRFDYLNNDIYSKSFTCDTSKIRNNETLYLGSSPSYWRGAAPIKLFSGSIEKFIVLSGQIPQSILYEIGKAFLGEYSFTSGAVSSTSVLSGFAPSVVYKTGVTGAYAEITGYATIRSGVDEFSQSLLATGSITIKEGDRYYKNYSDYLEQQGFLSGSNANTYAPTGDSASGTLGLQTGTTNISGYQILNSVPYTTTQVPLYKMTYLYGPTSEVSGITNVPVYNTVYTTGADSSGVSFSDQFNGFTKNEIYYLGSR